MDDSSSRLTQLLNRLGQGDATSREELLTLLYDELHALAARQMARERVGHTLQPTALLHEAWLRLDGHDLRFEGRKQFFALAGRVMRNVLVDHARARKAEKRGGEGEAVTLVEMAHGEREETVDLLALDEALKRLEAEDPELSKLVELRFFAGLSHPEIAETLETSLRSVERKWRFARTWLYDELSK